MPSYDIGEIAERLVRGEDLSTIAAALDAPPGPTPEQQAATAARQQLQDALGALNADSAPPGAEPDEDPIARSFKIADQTGHQRGSDERMRAYLDGVFEAAQRGDPRVVHDRTVDDETRQRWHQDAHRRQIANREESGMRRR